MKFWEMINYEEEKLCIIFENEELIFPKNIAKDKLNHYKIGKEEWEKINKIIQNKKTKIKYLIHNHINFHFPEPSFLDYRSLPSNCIGIIIHPSGIACFYNRNSIIKKDKFYLPFRFKICNFILNIFIKLKIY